MEENEISKTSVDDHIANESTDTNSISQITAKDLIGLSREELEERINEVNLCAKNALEKSEKVLKKFEEQQKQFKTLLEKIEANEKGTTKNNNLRLEDFIS